MPKGTIYLLPTALSEREPEYYLPSFYAQFVLEVKHFAVENIRTARRFLRRIQPQTDINGSTFYLLDKKSSQEDAQKALKPVLKGENLIIMSEAGAPGIADPGALLVRLAHQSDVKIVPFVGASSIMMAMMSSGLNGQNFAFSGYLPIKKPERIKRIKELSMRALRENQAQIFMETPYRNNHLLEDVLLHADKGLKLCIASNITAEEEFIQTKSLKAWKNNLPDLHKIPTIFILGKY